MEAVYLVCYDIADPKRLRQVHKATEDRGVRLQYSVYQCELTPLQLSVLQADLLELIAPAEDQVLLVHLGPNNGSTYGKIEALGRAYRPPEHRAYVL
jgi:CRISPR-associated protein Cas2